MLRRFARYFGFALLLVGAPHLFATTSLSPKDIPTAGILLGEGEHLLCGKSRDGKIQLENQAQFKVLSSEVAIVMEEWDYYDLITFSPNPYPMGGSDFYVTNLTRGGFVHADYSAGPRLNNVYTMKVLFVDPEYGEIYLTDNHEDERDRTVTRWAVEKKDWDYLRNWEVGETVLVGMNSNWFATIFSRCPYILVSYENLPYVTHIRAKPDPE